MEKPFPEFSFDLVSSSERQAINKEDLVRGLKVKYKLDQVGFHFEPLRVIWQNNFPQEWRQKVYLHSKEKPTDWRVITSTLSSLLGVSIYLSKVTYYKPVKK